MTSERACIDSLVTRYLLVDDHEAFRHLLARHLLSGCHPDAKPSVTECPDGQAALALYDEIQPHWVLMDVEMPILDGIAATRELLRRDPGARVVILTQNDSSEMEQACHQAGALGFLPKSNLKALPQLLESLNAV